MDSAQTMQKKNKCKAENAHDDGRHSGQDIHQAVEQTLPARRRVFRQINAAADAGQQHQAHSYAQQTECTQTGRPDAVPDGNAPQQSGPERRIPHKQGRVQGGQSPPEQKNQQGKYTAAAQKAGSPGQQAQRDGGAATPADEHRRQLAVPAPFQTTQHQTDAGTDAKQHPSGHKQGIVGRAAHIRSRHQPHVSRQGSQAGKEILRNMGRVAAEHERNKRVAYGPPKAQQGSRQQPAPYGRQSKTGKNGPPGHAQRLGRHKQAAHLLAQGHIHDKHHGRADEQGQHTGCGKPAQAGPLTGGFPYQRSQQKDGGKAVDHSGNGRHETNQAREPSVPHGRGRKLQSAGQPQRKRPSQQQGRAGQDKRTCQHGQNTKVRGGAPCPGEDQTALSAPEYGQGKTAHQDKQGQRGQGDKQGAQTGQSSTAAQKGGKHGRAFRSGAAGPPRIMAGAAY